MSRKLKNVITASNCVSNVIKKLQHLLNDSETIYYHHSVALLLPACELAKPHPVDDFRLTWVGRCFSQHAHRMTPSLLQSLPVWELRRKKRGDLIGSLFACFLKYKTQ